MGSLGKNIESNYKAYLENNNFLNNDAYDEQILNDSQIESSNKQGGWNFPGIRDRIEQLSGTVEKRNSVSTLSNAIKSLKATENTINAALNENNPMNDENALLTYRRQVRQLIKKAQNKYEDLL